MGLISLNAYPRTSTGKNENRRLRVAGRTPANIYGNERENAATIEVDTLELKRALAKGGRNPLFNLTVDGEGGDCVAVLREMQRHPVKDTFLHLDFMEIPLGVAMNFEVALDFVGENRKVRGGDAVLEIVRRSLEVECMPRKLPEVLEIDISELEIGDRIGVEDLSMEDVKILTDPEETVVKLTPNTIVVEEDEAAEGDEGEGAEGEATEGGDAPAEDAPAED